MQLYMHNVDLQHLRTHRHTCTYAHTRIHKHTHTHEQVYMHNADIYLKLINTHKHSHM